MSLNACPFCGGQGTVDSEDHGGPGDGIDWFVRCLSCGAEGPWEHTERAAMQLWNARYTRLQPAPVCAICGHIAREESGLVPVLNGAIVNLGTPGAEMLHLCEAHLAKWRRRVDT